MKLYPSLMAADQLRLAEQIKLVEPFCDGFHMDIMDDHFVNNLAGSTDLVEAVQQFTNKPINIHLMVEHPERWLDRIRLRAGDTFIFHWEATADHRAVELIKSVKSKGWLVGMAVNPKTPLAEIERFLTSLDLVMLMGVEPGWYGQAFVHTVMDKIFELVNLRDSLGEKFLIGVDGGIKREQIMELAAANVDMVAIGALVFSDPDPVALLKSVGGTEGEVQ